jgi:phosphocarrier protein
MRLDGTIPVAQHNQICRRQVGVGIVLGLHLRVADKLVRLANTFQSEILFHGNGIAANGKSILSLLSLAAECGTILTLEAEGYDAEDAVAALATLISNPTQESRDQGGYAA